MEGSTGKQVGHEAKRQRHLLDNRRYRERLDDTLAGLRETVPLALSQDLSDIPAGMQHRTDLPVDPVLLQRRWARISWQYADKYRDGSDACQATEAVKSKRHHDTGDARMRKREASMAAKVDLLGI